MKKTFKVTMLFKEVESHDEKGRNIKVKVDTVKKIFDQPGAEEPHTEITKERFFDVSVFSDPTGFEFLFDGCPLIIKGIQKVELIEEKK